MLETATQHQRPVHWAIASHRGEVANLGNGLVALFGLITFHIYEKTRQVLRGGKRVSTALQITRDGAQAFFMAANPF